MKGETKEDKLGELKKNVLSASQWLRIFYMALFALAGWLLVIVLCVVILVQALFSLASGSDNANLRQLGASLALYFHQILSFLVYESDRKPFPFSPFPSAAAASPEPSSPEPMKPEKNAVQASRQDEADRPSEAGSRQSESDPGTDAAAPEAGAETNEAAENKEQEGSAMATAAGADSEAEPSGLQPSGAGEGTVSVEDMDMNGAGDADEADKESGEGQDAAADSPDHGQHEHEKAEGEREGEKPAGQDKKQADDVFAGISFTEAGGEAKGSDEEEAKPPQ